MNRKIENILRKGMYTLGRAVESIIGHAKKAKVSMSPSTGVKPILAIEGQLNMPKIKELIAFSIDRVVQPIVPGLVDKSGLEMVDGPQVLSPLMKERGASIVVHADIGNSAGSYPKESRSIGVYDVRVNARNTPFEDGFFDFVIANLATAAQGDLVKTMKEIGRLTTPRGGGIIVDFHPFGQFAKRGSFRLRSAESIVRGVEDYYKICKVAGFSLDYIKEAFIDDTVRSLFSTQEEKYSFRSIKGSPFLVFLLVNKKGS